MAFTTPLFMQDLQNTTLCSLSLQTECALEFLKECSSQQNDGHLEAIRDLSESKELVKWIRTKSEGFVHTIIIVLLVDIMF